jgi:hypothetical protein
VRRRARLHGGQWSQRTRENVPLETSTLSGGRLGSAAVVAFGADRPVGWPSSPFAGFYETMTMGSSNW